MRPIEEETLIAPQPWSSITEPHDVRLVVCDMDGTLLSPEGALPAEFWPMLERLHERDVVFMPASGRQLATLELMFASAAELSFIAENGNLVVHAGEVVDTTVLDVEAVRHVTATVRDAATAGHDLGLVVCGRESAYIERSDAAFLSEAEKYYAKLAVVDDLTRVTDGALKLAAYDFAGAEAAASSVFAPLRETHQVVVSGQHWVDIMDPNVNKGRAVQAMQRALDVTPEQTVAFGDFLNDLEMLDAAGLSFAMENAHPEVRSRARYVAPSNRDAGVLRVLDRLLAA